MTANNFKLKQFLDRLTYANAKQTLYLLSFLICSLHVKAQDFKVKLTPDGDIKNDITAFYKNGDFVYSSQMELGKMQLAYTANLKKVKYGITVTKYDENLKELKTISIDNKEKDLGPFLPKVHYSKNGILVIYFRYGSDDKVKMYATKIDFDQLTINKTSLILEYDQKNMGLFGLLESYEKTECQIAVSPDETKLLLAHTSPKLIATSVVDVNLNQVQKTEYSSVNLRDITVTDTHIDNNGNKAILYRYDNPALKKFYERGIFFQPANKKGTFAAIAFAENKFPANLAMKESVDGKKLYIGGQYWIEDDNNGIKGVLLAEVNIEKQTISNPVYFSFTDEIKKRFSDLGFTLRKKGELLIEGQAEDIQINFLNNGVVVVSTDLQISSTSIKTNITYSLTGPVMHTFFKPDGKASFALLPKRQVASAVAGYITYVYNNRLICIHSDYAKNLENPIEDKKVHLSDPSDDMVPVAIGYDSNGEVVLKKALLDEKVKMKGRVLISSVIDYDKNKFLFTVGERKVNMARYYMRINHLLFVETL